jgi:hypothetical protein
MLRIPHCLDNRLTDGGKAVSPKHRPRSTPQKHYCSASGTHFCSRLSKPQGLVRLEGLGNNNNNNNNNNNSVALARERTILTNDRHLSAKLVPTVVDRGCRVVSAAEPYGRNLGFLDRGGMIFKTK